ncbi:MAG: tetratricopeptide repeat protein, partial [Elusimicrobiota bacterium]|nr:tetratricopeptide repeat protein [Elusimicrobiota bacterium]
ERAPGRARPSAPGGAAVSPRRAGERLAGAVAALALAAALVVSFRAFQAERHLLRAGLDASSVELGEALRLGAHPAHVNPSYRLPFVGLLEADAFLRAGPALESWSALFLLLTLGLVFALGRELGGSAAGAAAAALWAPVFASLPRGPGHLKQTALTALGLLAALLWARAAAAPSPASGLAAGLGFGATLLARGTYAFFPAAAAFLLPRRAALLLAGGTLAVLLPWTAMNAVAHRRFVPLEDGSMNMNVVTGALGTTFCAHGDFAALMGEDAGGQGFGSPLAWAARAVAAEPGRYARGVAARLARAVSLRPLLFLLAGLGLLLLRGDPAARAVGALCAYFLVVNCAMSIEDNYFEPLWPLLAALAAAPLARLPDPAPAAGAAVSRAVLAVCVFFVALAGARQVALVVRYAASAAARPPWSEAALDAALAREPGAPWLALEHARRLLGRGDAAGAAAALAAATPLEGLPRREVLLAWALAKGGRPGLLLDLETAPRDAPAPWGDAQAETAAVYRALALDGLGRRDEARERMRDAAREWAAWQGFLHPGAEAAADALAPRLRGAAGARFLVRLDQVLAGQDPADLERAVELAAESSGDPAGWRRLFEERLRRGEAARAASALESLERLATGREERREAAFGWERLGRPERAAASFARLLAEDPRDAVTWSDRGVALYRAGRRAEAMKAFERALALDPGLEAARVSLAAARAAPTRR